jgi:hypothetical protein
MRQRLYACLLVTLLLFPSYRVAAAQSGVAVAKAAEELERLRELAKIGAISQARLRQAEDLLADARDEEILGRLLYGKIGVESLSEAQAKDMVEAAQRRVERVAGRYKGQKDLVSQGVLPQRVVDDLERELAERRLGMQLAESRARIFSELLSMAKAEEFLVEEDEELGARPLIESYKGSGGFKEAHLRYIEAAYEKQFGKPLPISARGQTALHTSLGFDHSGRVDVGVNPDEEEGVWLRKMLESLKVPYIALRAMIPGASTAPHIHIGLPSARLRIVDGPPALGNSGLGHTGASGLH